ncbi:CDP-glucose 4,6-dehydratase [Paenibacillus sp. PL2-23]|uniref:CDP-glucose 4,6-dehydratase n=1 Tax=Paenibacillus sp. PL2-23 TaxID=2100729 RepID=UPI0030F8E642
MRKPQPVNQSFWEGKKVFLTGHTGFKGGWLSLWLNSMGAKVYGYSLAAPTEPSLFSLANLEDTFEGSRIGDINDLTLLQKSIDEFEPEILIHLAAQSLVRKSYTDPVNTFQTNIMGTVNVLEAARTCGSLQVILNVTTDKCYENQEWHWSYREIEPLGGFDPYSSSKACSELITMAYRRSFYNTLGIGIATARAGNVIGGGDWAENRLIPDILTALTAGVDIQIRNPKAVRPWQHVLEPLSGYLVLCQNLHSNPTEFSEPWNFGPNEYDTKPVEWIVQQLIKIWPSKTNNNYTVVPQENLHEANNLKLDCSKALQLLRWSPTWPLEKALQATVQWHLEYVNGGNLTELCRRQIKDYEKDMMLK